MAKPNYKLETGVRFELGKGDSAYYAGLFGTGSYSSSSGFEYWSLLFRAGYTAKLPKLISP